MKFICHPRVSVELIFGCAHESGLCPLVGRSVGRSVGLVLCVCYDCVEVEGEGFRR